VGGRSATPFGVDSYDNPETIRFKKYATGLQLTLQGAGIETGQTPREVVWAKDKARLYHYEPEKPKKYPVPILLV
jgi:polyhydroxyalkanoate synthase